MKQWQLQEAKAHLSQLVKEVVKDGPQSITLHGEPVVVVIAQKQFNKLIKNKPNFVKFMRQSPLMGSGLDFARDGDLTRDIDL